MGTVISPDRAEVAVRDVPALLEQGAALLDVREPGEWQAGHAAAAVHVPLRELSLDGLPDGDPLLVVCHVGGRSAMATQALNNAGVHALNVAGGMAAWEEAGLPVVTDAGQPGQVI
jgi:rhodanese-related sulfurtransferase